jgi:adenosylhomocysteinase
MKSGAVLCNSGHFDAEINLRALKRLATHVAHVRGNVEEYTLRNGRKLRLIAEGRLVNLSAAEGHPAAVMDMSFADQALAAEYLSRKGRSLGTGVYAVPKELDERVARLKLGTLGIAIDKLTAEQREYLASYQHGT